MLECQRDTCKIELSRGLDQEFMAECNEFIEKIKEARHFKTLEQQKAKYETLCMNSNYKDKGKDGCSKMENMHRYMHQNGTENSRQTATTSTAPKATFKWVINMSSN